MKTQANILNITFQLMSTSISLEFNRAANSHRLLLEIKGSENVPMR